MDKKLDIKKFYLLSLAIIFVLFFVCVFLFGVQPDVALATDSIEVTITDSVLTSVYSYDSNMSITGTISFRDISHFQVEYLWKTKDDTEYHDFQDNKRDEDNSFTFIFGGPSFDLNNYDIKVVVSCFVVGEGTYYGQWEGEFSVTKAPIPQSIVDEMAPVSIVYGQELQEISSMYSTNATFEFSNEEDKTLKPVPGVYDVFFNVYPRSGNYYPAFNVARKVTVEKRNLVAVVDHQWSFVGEPVKELTYNLFTQNVLPGDEDSYTFSVALDREIDGPGTYYIVGTMVSDKYSVTTITPTTEFPDSSTYALYNVYENVKVLTIENSPFESVNIYQDNGFPLNVSFSLQKLDGFFNYERADAKKMGEYRIVYYENGNARVPDIDYYVTEIKMPEYKGKTIVVVTRKGSEIIANDYIVDQYGRIALNVDPNGEFAIYEVGQPASEPSVENPAISDTIAGVIGACSAIGALMILGGCALIVNVIKKKKNKV